MIYLTTQKTRESNLAKWDFVDALLIDNTPRRHEFNEIYSTRFFVMINTSITSSLHHNFYILFYFPSLSPTLTYRPPL